MRRQRIGYSRKIFSRPEFERIIEANFTPREAGLIMNAYRDSKYGHKNQTRLDRITRYFDHPKSVALILLLECKVFLSRVLILGLIHDLGEDSFIRLYQDIVLVYGKRVAKAWLAITKSLDRDYFAGLANSPWWVILVKLADRLHNLRQMTKPSKSFRRRKLRETEEYYPALMKAFKKKVPKKYRYLVEFFETEFAYAMAKVRRSLKK